MIRAVVFDFDGLILDTETNKYRAWVELFHQFGSVLPLEMWSQKIGTHSNFNPLDYLEACIRKPIDRKQYMAIYQKLFAAQMEEEHLRPGVVSLLEQARRLGLGIGVASSSTSDWVTGYLTQFGIRDYFGCIRAREHVAQVKPDPELYRQVVEHLGAKPEEAIAFEDSPNGALAAHRAGLYCVVVPNPVTETLTFGSYSKSLTTLEGLDLQALITEITCK